MRDFYYKILKNLVGIYVFFLMIFSYRMIYNEYYFELQEDISVSIVEEKRVYPFGKVVGIHTVCEGIFVIDTCKIENKNGEYIDIAKESVKTGDYIISINGEKASEKEELVQAVKESQGRGIFLEIKRKEEIFVTQLTPIQTQSGEYMLGIWVKDDLAGVGTITYFTMDGEFAALGHGMGDGETQNILNISGGDIYVSRIIGIEKGKRGTPGEIKGIIHYGRINHLGKLNENTGRGIYGMLDKEEFQTYISQQKSYEIANIQEIKQGKAQIFSDVSGELQVYDIEITYVDYLAKDSNKGLHFRVVDPNLISLTGGIVQGMGVIDNMDNTKKPVNTGFSAVTLNNEPNIGV